jgi:hypothetical protein
MYPKRAIITNLPTKEANIKLLNGDKTNIIINITDKAVYKHTCLVVSA